MVTFAFRMSKVLCTLVSILAVLLIVCLHARAPRADEPDYRSELPRIAPLEPAEAIGSFRFSSDIFEIEQVAAEPLVASPVALDFDADGRMFVVEMRDYSEQDKERLGRVRLLEDTDLDGRYEKATIFADNLSWPTAVACANGGVFVGAAPYIYFLKDDDGDGRADEKRIAFTGFNRDNVQGLLNSFQWGIDNRLHGATSSAGGEGRRADENDVARSGDRATTRGDVRRPDVSQAKPVDLRGRDFSIDTRTLQLASESGGGQHGMSFDEWGRKFVCSNSDHIQLITAEDRYLARNPFLAAPPARVSIAADGPQAEVFRDSPVEPWRILRTRLRVAGAVPGPIEGGGRAAGYFTGATGVTIYRGDAWPAEYRGNALIGDVGSNIVHRKTLSPNGVLLIANRAEQNREFLASRDIWFRPAQFANGPDGNLYVIDVYREVIEHPASLPPPIKKHLDLTSGRDRGRIYRIKPKGFQRQPLPRLSGAGLAELVKLLEYTNGWHRQTASRLLYERNDKTAVPLLLELVAKSKSPLGRMHAMRALDGLDGLTGDVVINALCDDHPGVRRHAVQLAERRLSNDALRAALAKMTDDDDLLVRYQLAFTLGELPVAERLKPLATIARGDADHAWMRVAIQSSLAEGAADVCAELLGDAKFRKTAGAQKLLADLARLVGAQSRVDDFTRLAQALRDLGAANDEQAIVQAIAVAVIQGAGGATIKPDAALFEHPAIAAAVHKAVAASRVTALDRSKRSADRVRAIETLALGPFTETRETFAALLAADQPPDVHTASVAAIARLREPAAAQLLIESWASFTPRLRPLALDGLLASRASTELLLNAVERDVIAAAHIDPGRAKQLRGHRDRAIRERAKQLWSAVPQSLRDAVVAEYQQALRKAGSTEKGRTVFRTVCAGCHRAEGQGHELGPNLATIQNRGAETVLLNILDPNREVNPQYVNYVVVTKSGQSASGMIAGESATSITLRRGEGQSETILRGDIEELTSTGMSLMPEGVEKQISIEAMADLLAYLTALK
jgi:putative membrane-bound dehydrogenase-like protein